MAASGLNGIGSLEEMFLGASQNAAADGENKCDSAEGISEQEDMSSDLQADSCEAMQIYAIDMDISETMGTFKSRAEEAFNLDLQDCRILVLSEMELGDDDTLQKQCGTSSGTVQIQFAVKEDIEDSRGYIDILDVLKSNEESSPIPKPEDMASPEKKTSGSDDGKPNKILKTMRWIVCPTFKELQRVLKIPQDPHEWSAAHVRHWLLWAIYQFGLQGINVNSTCWNRTGKELFSLGQTEFQKLVPEDPADMFYMHFELLRRTNVVAVVCDPNSAVPKPAPPKSNSSMSFIKTDAVQAKSSLEKVTKDVPGKAENSESGEGGSTSSQQIQLWQFLLELLTTPKLYPIISWYGNDGEFRLHQPEVVASLWGQRKNKPRMNYEKLSRALRYYYEGDMISKVYGKRFVYKFVLDLKSVVGYSADELKRQVEECHNVNFSSSVVI
ncbi:DNA-binding protein Ets97D-like isoform X2 [Macrobrachium rosenbergii]|uniref:DNA-binding protein Ets97D-like isoform X2 n=1 Tax=Macrobrachium rosenbergii TaxID=79674 RepID=UPI0034D64B67